MFKFEANATIPWGSLWQNNWYKFEVDIERIFFFGQITFRKNICNKKDSKINVFFLRNQKKGTDVLRKRSKTS